MRRAISTLSSTQPSKGSNSKTVTGKRIQHLKNELKSLFGDDGVGMTKEKLPKYIIGLDISTKTTGFCVIDSRGVTLDLGYLEFPPNFSGTDIERANYLASTALVPLFNYYSSPASSTSITPYSNLPLSTQTHPRDSSSSSTSKTFLSSNNSTSPPSVVFAIEQSLSFFQTSFYSQKDLVRLARFNGMISFLTYSIQTSQPIFVPFVSARALFGLNKKPTTDALTKKEQQKEQGTEEGREGGKRTTVHTGRFRKGIETKEHIWSFVASRLPRMNWPMRAKLKTVKQTSFDACDAWIVAQYALHILRTNHLKNEVGEGQTLSLPSGEGLLRKRRKTTRGEAEGKGEEEEGEVVEKKVSKQRLKKVQEEFHQAIAKAFQADALQASFQLFPVPISKGITKLLTLPPSQEPEKKAKKEKETKAKKEKKPEKKSKAMKGKREKIEEGKNK